MSDQTVVVQNGSQLFVNDDFQKIFIWDNEYEQATFKNNTGALASFQAGLLLGRDSSDNTIVPLDSAVTGNGEEIPVGVLAQDINDVADAGTVDNKYFCINGGVAENKLILQNGADNLDTTIINSRTLRDLIKSATKGIKIVESDELTGSDNS